jgi:hypothetical protein
MPTLKLTRDIIFCNSASQWRTAVSPVSGNKRLAAILGVIIAILGLALDAMILRAAPAGASDKFYRACAWIGTPLDLLLLTASIGALASRARYRLLRLWAVLAIVYGTCRVVWAIVVVAPATTGEARVTLAGKPSSEFGPEFAGMMTTAVAAVVFVITSGLPAFILFAPRERRALTLESAPANPAKVLR